MNILNTIVARKREEVLARKLLTSEQQLTDRLAFSRGCYSLSSSIAQSNNCGIIAEFKRKSPSKPNINQSALAVEIIPGYQKSGAAAVSILTDIDFFGGDDDDLIHTRPEIEIPVLRKDFVIDPYQIIEAKSIGADAILLIAEILSKDEIDEFSKIAVECGLEILMEIHSADQLKKYNERIRNIGVNNRNLKTFDVNIQYSKDIFHQLPINTIKISESGIDDPQKAAELTRTGYNGFLIGENFMKTKSPADACARFIHQLKSYL